MNTPISIETEKPLNSISTAQFELQGCDEDIKKHFGATEEHEMCVYSSGLPTKIQLNRLLRILTEELEKFNANSKNSNSSYVVV